MGQGGGGISSGGGTQKRTAQTRVGGAGANAPAGAAGTAPARWAGRRRLRTALWALVFLGALAALMSARNRWQVERANRRVEIALDFNELRSLAATQGVPLPDVLRTFKQAGAVSVALQEDTIGALEDARRIAIAESGERGTVLVPGAGATAQAEGPALLRHLQTVFGFKTHFTTALTTSGPLRLSVNQPWSFVRGVGVGLDPSEVKLVSDAHLGIVGRIGNYGGAEPRGIVASLKSLKDAGASTVIFTGDEVLGNKAFIADDPKEPNQPSTASALRESSLQYGTVEFGKQKGDPLLTRAAVERVVRVHTVTGAEMQAADMPGNIQRFLLAARERDIRVLFVRLFLDEPDPINKNANDYIKKIADGLKDKGELEAGLAHGFDPLVVPIYLRALMGVGVAAGFWLLLDSITGFLTGGTGRVIAVAAAAGGLLLFALPIAPVSGYKGVQYAALAAALVFPTLGLVRHDLLRPASPRENPLFVALTRFAQATVVTGLGIAFIVGLLADRLFLVKAEVFTGVKATLIVPVLLVALLYVLNLRATQTRTFSRAVADARARVATFAAQPLLIWQVAAALAILVVLALLVMRSGNDSPVGVSGFELKLRSLQDRVFYARPRFKETLCHPALLIALLLAARPSTPRLARALALPLLIMGAIGQASLLNSFCHLHTPLVFIVWRALLGIGIGVVIGALVYLLLDRFVLRRLAPNVSPVP